MKKIAIGGDHAGYELKAELISYLNEIGYSVKDFGTYSDESTDYPDYVHPLANAIENGEFKLGIILCGSANGVSMTANKHQGIRAALSWTPEIAELGRLHNDANVLAIPARYVNKEEAIEIVKAFISTDFEGGRHQRRVDKIAIN